MNEAVLRRQPAQPLGGTGDAAGAPAGRAAALRGYALLTLAVLAGWLLRDVSPINAEEGLGYWLGIAGGSLMLLLLLYPLRKRVRVLHRVGSTRFWFRSHMVLGLVGPLLILYHCNFRLGSFNSQVALYCMLLVAGSGLVGRYIYARIHQGLYGRRTTLRELQKELAVSLEQSHGLGRFMPKLVARLDKIAHEVQGDAITQSLGIRRSLRWAVLRPFLRLSLGWTARRELAIAAVASPTIARNLVPLRRCARRYVRDYTKLVGRVAQFSFYERLFALWHVLHLPIFLMMVLSALVHVLAVHMY